MVRKRICKIVPGRFNGYKWIARHRVCKTKKGGKKSGLRFMRRTFGGGIFKSRLSRRFNP